MNSKNLLLVAISFCFSMVSGAQISQRISFPQHSYSGANFDYESSVNGICRALGYESGAKGSKRYDSSRGMKDVIQVNSSGYIAKVDRDYPVSSVLCINFQDRDLGEISYKISFPQHSYSGANFDYESSVNGICRALGYESGAKGSKRYDSSRGMKDVIQVNSSGYIAGVDRDYPVSSVFCINFQDRGLGEAKL